MQGEYVFGTLEIDLALVKKIGGLKALKFQVIDSLGRFQRLPRSSHRKFSADILKLERG